MSFTPGRARGRQLAIFLPAEACRLIDPWRASRQRSARLAAIIERYGELTGLRPAGLDLHEWAVAVQLLGGLATMRDVGRLWAEVLDFVREGRALPGVDAERLSRKLRQLVPAEQVAVLEVADRVALDAEGSLRERLAAAGLGAGA